MSIRHSKIQWWMRRLLGVMSTDEVELATMRAYKDARNDIERALNQLHSTEDSFRKAEVEMQRVAADMTLALYDAVEKIIAEVEEAKRAVEKEKGSDKQQ